MCGMMLPKPSIRGKIRKRSGVISMTFRAAVLQMRSVNREYESNIKTIIKYMSDAKQNGADILLLPECFITGYDLTIDNASAITENDLAPLCENAKD
jgi:predicted amidohydrolase